MHYCADTWFLLELFAAHPKAINVIEDIKNGKSTLIAPLTTYAETTRKLMQKGIPRERITDFLDLFEATPKIAIGIPTKEIAAEAARISVSHNLALMDSFVASTCKMTGCDALLTADRDYTPLVKKKYLSIKTW